MRRDGWNAGRVSLWLQLRKRSWQHSEWLPAVADDRAVLTALEKIWDLVVKQLPRSERIMRVGVTLLDLTRSDARQLDLLINDDKAQRRCERITHAVDAINRKYGRTLVSFGPWAPPPGGYAGGKISFTRIPRAEDFW